MFRRISRIPVPHSFLVLSLALLFALAACGTTGSDQPALVVVESRRGRASTGRPYSAGAREF